MTFFDYPGDEPVVTQHVAQQAFLPDATEGEWSDLLRMATVRRLVAGETVISPGATDRSLFVVLEGQLEVLAPSGRKWRHVMTAGAGSIVGEASFIDSVPRAVLARAVSNASVAELTRESFAALGRTRPELAIAVAMDAARVLAQRAQATG